MILNGVSSTSNNGEYPIYVAGVSTLRSQRDNKKSKNIFFDRAAVEIARVFVQPSSSNGGLTSTQNELQKMHHSIVKKNHTVGATAETTYFLRSTISRDIRSPMFQSDNNFEIPVFHIRW